MKSHKLLFPREGYVGYITPRAGFAADSFAKIVFNDEVKARRILAGRTRGNILQENTVEYFDHFQDANLDAGFFEQFTSDAFLKSFAELQRAARN